MAPKNNPNPPRLSMESLGRTIPDITFELTKESQDSNLHNLHPISEVEDAKCECCGMSEECTQEYINKVRKKYSGKLICGFCSEAVKGEMEKNGGKILEEALKEHMNSCAKFNRLGRAYPVLCQAEAIREILKKNREKSPSPKDKGNSNNNKGGIIARSSSCMASMANKVINNRGVVN